jgi:protein TonB
VIAKEVPAPKPTIVSNPDWLRKPDADDMARYYPDRAQRMAVSGHATITCTVNANGTVGDCSIISETPSDQGFGDAALHLSKLFKMKPQTRDGVPTAGGKVTIPIGFQIPKDN